MLLNLDGMWTDGMTLAASGAVLISVLLLAACSLCGLCRDGQGPAERNAV